MQLFNLNIINVLTFAIYQFVTFSELLILNATIIFIFSHNSLYNDNLGYFWVQVEYG